MRKREEKNQQIHVRYLEQGDQNDLLALLSDSANAKKAGLQITANPQVRKWAVQQWIRKRTLVGVFNYQQLIGLITVFPDESIPEVGYFVDPAYENHHVMTFALGQFLEDPPSLNLSAEVAANNVASQHVLENNGFIRVKRSQGLIHYRWQMV